MTKPYTMLDFLFFRAEKSYFKLKFSEIVYIQADKKHVIIVTTKKNYFSSMGISEVEKVLPRNLFCRVHRSYIISLEHTEKFDYNLVYMGDKKIPIADQYRNLLKESVTIINVDIQSLGINKTKFNGF